VTVNPLVAPAIERPADGWAGIWIAEDIQLIVQGVRSGSWVDTTLGSIGASLDGLAFVSDPGGALLQYLASWAMEHFRPLTEVLDWLAGDPGQIAAHAQTWRNIGNLLRSQPPPDDIPDWHGLAAIAYRDWTALRLSAVDGLAAGTEAMATITESAGYAVAAVRVLVRDLIAIAFSRAITYLAELAFSEGFAAPLVVEQITTLALATSNRIARVLRALVDSLRRLFEVVPRLLTHLDELRAILSRLTHPAAPRVIPGPAGFDPLRLRGLRPDEVVASIPGDWIQRPSTHGGGSVYADPANPGRQVRIMPGYPPGSRPDPVTWGPYAVVSQNGRAIKIPLAGNPTLP
jgi:hypothetical protein